MSVYFDGAVAKLRQIDPGQVFVTRHNQETLIGITARIANDPAALILAGNPAVKVPLLPCLVSHHHIEMTLQDPDLITIPSAVIVPDFSETGLTFQSTVKDGPGMLTVSTGAAIVRALRPDTNFIYVNLTTGTSSNSFPQGVEVPRWSIRMPLPVTGARTIFDFTGPKQLP